MTENKKQKQYDLEDRTFNFAKRVRAFVKRLPKTIANIEDGKQVIKASGSVGRYWKLKRSGNRKKKAGYRIKRTDKHFWGDTSKVPLSFETLQILNFRFVSDFDIRISDFLSYT